MTKSLCTLKVSKQNLKKLKIIKLYENRPNINEVVGLLLDVFTQFYAKPKYRMLLLRNAK